MSKEITPTHEASLETGEEKPEPKTVYGEFTADLNVSLSDEAESTLYVPDWPISIALVGAPDSGKSAIIESFVEQSKDFFEEQDKKLRVLDNAGGIIEEEFDQAMGPYGGFRDDVWAFYRGFENERLARSSGDSFIRNGSVLENMAHAGANLESIMIGGIVTPDTEERAHQVQMAMTHLTYLYFSEFRYKFVFYSPQMEQIILPDQDDYRGYNQRVDAALRQIIVNFNLKIQMLKGESVVDRAAEMFDTIQKIMTEGVQIPAELAESISAA